MGRDGLLIGEVASRSGSAARHCGSTRGQGFSQRPGARTRVTGSTGQSSIDPDLCRSGAATRLHLDEIKEVVQIKRSGRCPCSHVLDLVRQKVEELDRTLADLTEVRRGLQGLLRSSSRSARRGEAAVCHHIERLKLVKGRR